MTNFERTNLERTNFKRTNFERTNFKRTSNPLCLNGKEYLDYDKRVGLIWFVRKFAYHHSNAVKTTQSNHV